MTDVKQSAMHTPPPNGDNLTSMLLHLGSIASDESPLNAGDSVSLRDVLTAIGERSYGPALLLLGLISISPATVLPGTTWIVASITLLVSVQMLIGSPHVWLPKRALSVSMPKGALRAFLSGARPWAKVVDAILKPRLQFLAEPPFLAMTASACVAIALVTYPLGLIPLAPLLPGISIILFGLGVAAKDGLVLLLGGVVFGLAGWLAIRLILIPF